MGQHGCIWTFWGFSLILKGSVPRGIVSCYGVKDICQRGRIELENEWRQKMHVGALWWVKIAAGIQGATEGDFWVAAEFAKNNQ